MLLLWKKASSKLATFKKKKHLVMNTSNFSFPRVLWFPVFYLSTNDFWKKKVAWFQLLFFFTNLKIRSKFLLFGGICLFVFWFVFVGWVEGAAWPSSRYECRVAVAAWSLFRSVSFHATFMRLFSMTIWRARCVRVKWITIVKMKLNFLRRDAFWENECWTICGNVDYWRRMTFVNTKVNYL